MRRRKLKPATIHQVHRTLRTALNEAVRRGQIVTNPATVAKAPRLVEEEIVPFTVEEAQRILAVAAARRNGVRFALALALGLRQGEALGLQWADLDETAETLTVRRAIQRHTWRHGCQGECGGKRGADCPDRHGGGLAVVDTKSRAGRRVVGVPTEMVTELKEHRTRQEAERDLAANLWHDGDGCSPSPPASRSTPGRLRGMAFTAQGGQGTRGPTARRPAHGRHHAPGAQGPNPGVMDVMGWSQASMAGRYQHVPVEVLNGIAGQVSGLLWKTDKPGDDGAAGVLARV